MKRKSIHPGLALCAQALVVLGVIAFVSPVRGDESKLSSKDKSFITDASEAGNAEVEKANLANKTSSDLDVKSFAEMMVTDHTKAGDELKTIAQGKGVEVAKGPGTMQKADIELLKAKSGKSFDKAYAKQAVSDHKKAVALFEKASTDLDDADLKAFAEKTLPTLKHHLEEAEKLEAKFTK